MTYIFAILFVAVVGYLLVQKRRPDDGAHPLDGATKPRASWPYPGGEVGEGKIHVKVADVAPVAVEPVAPGKSEADRVEAPAPVVEQAPVKKAPAKKPAVKKPAAAKKAPAKKKST